MAAAPAMTYMEPAPAVMMMAAAPATTYVQPAPAVMMAAAPAMTMVAPAPAVTMAAPAIMMAAPMATAVGPSLPTVPAQFSFDPNAGMLPDLNCQTTREQGPPQFVGSIGGLESTAPPVIEVQRRQNVVMGNASENRVEIPTVQEQVFEIPTVQ